MPKTMKILVPNYNHVEIEKREMNEIEMEIYQKQNDVIKEHFPGLKARDVKIMNKNVYNIAASASIFLKINKKCYSSYSDKKFKNLLIHELIHFYLFDNCLEHGHRKHFKIIANYFGLNEYYDRTHKYFYRCEKCGSWFKNLEKHGLPTCRNEKCNNENTIKETKINLDLDIKKMKNFAMNGNIGCDGYNSIILNGNEKQIMTESYK